MKDESTNLGGPGASATNTPSLPAAVDRATFQADLDRLRVREKAHTREGDAIAAARRRLPMVEIDANLALIGSHGPLATTVASRPENSRTNGRPTAQWSRLEAGRSDDLSPSGR
jgi:hypothetical protein